MNIIQALLVHHSLRLLGSDLMDLNSKTAVVLGGTVPHIQLINELKNRGFRVVLIDYYENPPAKVVADKHIQESTLDKESVLKIAKQEEAALVISSCVDQANAVCCYIAEKLNLPRPYSYETSLDSTDKGRMKKIFFDNLIPTSNYQVVESLDKKISTLNYPLVVKPVDSNSSKGVHRADTDIELKIFSKEAFTISRSHQIIVEEYCEGIEIQVDCLAVNGTSFVLMTREKRQLAGSSIELNTQGSVVPARLSKEEMEQVTVIAQKVCKAFKLKSTPFFFQAKVHNKKINVIEFAPRIGGGLSSELIKVVTGIDMLQHSIDSYLGNSLKIPKLRETKKVYATVLMYMKPGVFGSIKGLEKLKLRESYEYVSILKKPGEVVSSELNSGNRVACMILSASSEEEIRSEIDQVYNTIEIYDIEGKACMRRSLT